MFAIYSPCSKMERHGVSLHVLHQLTKSTRGDSLDPGLRHLVHALFTHGCHDFIAHLHFPHPWIIAVVDAETSAFGSAAGSTVAAAVEGCWVLLIFAAGLEVPLSC